MKIPLKKGSPIQNNDDLTAIKINFAKQIDLL